MRSLRVVALGFLALLFLSSSAQAGPIWRWFWGLPPRWAMNAGLVSNCCGGYRGGYAMPGYAAAPAYAAPSYAVSSYAVSSYAVPSYAMPSYTMASYAPGSGYAMYQVGYGGGQYQQSPQHSPFDTASPWIDLGFKVIERLIDLRRSGGVGSGGVGGGSDSALTAIEDRLEKLEKALLRDVKNPETGVLADLAGRVDNTSAQLTNLGSTVVHINEQVTQLQAAIGPMMAGYKDMTAKLDANTKALADFTAELKKLRETPPNHDAPAPAGPASPAEHPAPAAETAVPVEPSDALAQLRWQLSRSLAAMEAGSRR